MLRPQKEETPEVPDLRQDPITGRWVIIATERARRPNDYMRHPVTLSPPRNCPFCEGNEKKTPPEIFSYRTRGAADEPGWTVRVVPNKFPALRPEGDLNHSDDGPYQRMKGVGAHDVIIESPDHMSTFGSLPAESLASAFFAFRQRILDLSRDPRLRCAVLFKNHGEAAGASLEHTHSQLIALPVVPKQLQEEIDGAARLHHSSGRCIYCQIEQFEREGGERLILETEHFLVLCPFAPRFPFETWVLPRVHGSHFERAPDAVLHDLGGVMQTLVGKLERVLGHPAYNLVIHSSPLREKELEHYHWHIELIARLTRVAGFEWGSGIYLNPTPPEEAARFLKEA